MNLDTIGDIDKQGVSRGASTLLAFSHGVQFSRTPTKKHPRRDLPRFVPAEPVPYPPPGTPPSNPSETPFDKKEKQSSKAKKWNELGEPRNIRS